MDSKIFILIGLLIELKISEGLSQMIECEYGNKWSWTIGSVEGTKNNTFYSCYLRTKSINFDQNPSKIDGKHRNKLGDVNVKFLHIPDGNPLWIFSPLLCNKFKNLEIIWTQNAKIEITNENALENCENLHHLAMNGNNFTKLPANFLTKNSKLTKIWFQNNNLKSMPENIFAKQNELIYLDLSENQISFLHPNTFKALENLEKLYLHNNKISTIDSNWFETLQKLKILAVSNNEISQFSPRVFKPLKDLEQLFAYENRITALNTKSFEGLENLHKLSLSSNQISALPKNVFAPLKNIQFLYLDHNILTTINSNSFENHPNLTTIWLQNNRIEAFDEEIMKKAAAAATLNITNNICFNSTNRSEIRENLQKCFKNFQLLKTTTLKPEIMTNIELETVTSISKSQSQKSSVNWKIDGKSCGKSAVLYANLIDTQHIAKGAFPWNAALVTNDGGFICGGILVSKQKVVTAAHCIQDKRTLEPRLVGELVVFLGVYDLESSIEAGRSIHAIEHIYIHPEWNPLVVTYDADIAVLFLENVVTFNTHIQPVCLAAPSSQASSLVDGFVLGYGRSADPSNNNESKQKIPRLLKAPVHQYLECYNSNHSFALFSSGRTLCAGLGRGIGLCTEDSGSGLYVDYDGAFYLRGITSSSLTGRRRGCDNDSYSVFTDVTKFYDWIINISET